MGTAARLKQCGSGSWPDPRRWSSVPPVQGYHYATMCSMNVTLCNRTGLMLRNPVIAASGTFGYGTEFANRMDLSALGALVSKGTTFEPRAGNQPVRLSE